LFKEIMAQAQAGHPAPDFTLATLDGQAITLSDSRGRPALLVFLRHLG
jgi:peroxiredoxin